MKSKFFPVVLVLLVSAALPSSAFAKYNPATDNPYIKMGNSGSKKWYEFYKKDKSSAYVTKNSGYWYSTKRENILVRGAKTAAGGIKEIAQSVF